MTIAGKIQCSADKTQFTLYKEGLFYKCYNEDAMVFVANIREYKVNSKFIKSVGATVYNIGFPVSEVVQEVYPRSLVQRCIVHMVRTSVKHVSWNDLRAVCKDLKKMYSKDDSQSALEELDHFD